MLAAGRGPGCTAGSARVARGGGSREGKSYEARQSVGSRVLRVLAAEGRIRRARPRGSWTSSQFRWTLQPDAAKDTGETEVAAAKAELARRYLAAFGPATLDDLKWWTGWTVTDTRRALAAIGAEDVDLDDGSTGCLPADWDEPAPAPEPWVALLPGLDATAMGGRNRSFYLNPDHVSALYDRNGNIGPTIWADGRIAGAWAQRPDGHISRRLLTDPGTESRTAIDTTAHALSTWLGPTRITPSYRTPLERELAAPHWSLRWSRVLFRVGQRVEHRVG